MIQVYVYSGTIKHKFVHTQKKHPTRSVTAPFGEMWCHRSGSPTCCESQLALPVLPVAWRPIRLRCHVNPRRIALRCQPPKGFSPFGRVGHSEVFGKNWSFFCFASKKHVFFLNHFLFFFLKKAPGKPLQALTKKNYLYIIKGKIVESQGRARLVDDETPGLHLGRQRSCCICSSIGKGIAGTNLPKKIFQRSEIITASFQKKSLLGPKANHSERMRKGWKPSKPFTCWGSCLKTGKISGVHDRLIGWVPFIKYIYIWIIYTLEVQGYQNNSPQFGMIKVPYKKNSLWWKPILLMVFGLLGYTYIYIHIYPLSSQGLGPPPNQPIIHVSAII